MAVQNASFVMLAPHLMKLSIVSNDASDMANIKHLSNSSWLRAGNRERRAFILVKSLDSMIARKSSDNGGHILQV
jgi:hypothetical protein